MVSRPLVLIPLDDHASSQTETGKATRDHSLVGVGRKGRERDGRGIGALPILSVCPLVESWLCFCVCSYFCLCLCFRLPFCLFVLAMGVVGLWREGRARKGGVEGHGEDGEEVGEVSLILVFELRGSEGCLQHERYIRPFSLLFFQYIF